ncbi:hypothetical protein MARPO_0038s0037 [Marchantia polymorpha]|uniref:Uncharacterized protein n=1 Tax=Marchantia polymorpha TaxID=3197 RepID=A0A2R6X3L3_MARPO|nr:hypothetical protein MARPO_0038s0037 [Marchantia polymorpha]|eukprot:PTQ40682.1 hypothetical protein MARPO_0038s0037 [Marchantia polymorpha]
MDGMYGAMKGPRRYSGAVGTIELDDFIQEFDTWCDMQFLRNPTLFTPFFAWKGLFQHLEGPPMDDYHEFGREYAVEIDAWRHHWSPNYTSITQGGVGTSGGASGSITDGTSGAGTTSGAYHLCDGMNGMALQALETEGRRGRWSSTRGRDARRCPSVGLEQVSAGTRAGGVVAVVPIGESVITEEFGGSVEDHGGFTRSGLRYRLPHPSASVVVEAWNVADSGSLVVISSRVPHSWTGDMDGMYGAMKGPRRYSGAVGTIELDDFIHEFDTWCDMQFLRNPTLFTPFFAWKGLFQHLERPPMDDYHEFGREYAVEIDAWRRHWSPKYTSIIQGGVGTSGGASGSITDGTSGAGTTSGAVGVASTSGETTGVPSFSPIPEFFKRLRKNYQGVRTEKLRSLLEFERKTGESLREAYTRMRRLISITHGVTEAQAVQYWYRILDKELRRRVRDATLLSDASPTLAYVFALSEKIELNIVEEKVVTSSFARDAATTSRVPQSTAQSRPFGGGSGGGRGVQTRHQTAARDTGARALVPSFAGQQQGPACWTCGGDHRRRDCPQEAGGQSSQARPQSAQVVCDHCGRADHTRDRCFDLHPELTSGGRGRGGDASRGRGGRAGRGGRGAGVVGRPVASATSSIESAMAARIEQLEQRLAAMATSGASTSTSYVEEYFPYLASAAQVEASVAVTRGAARALEPRGATGELDPQRGEGGRQARLPQSFLLSEVGSTSSMRPVPPSDLSGRTETSTSRVVDTDTPSSAVTRMASSVMRSPLFSAMELIDSGINLARVFRAAATLCERGSITATSAEIGETIGEELSSTTPLNDESTWQAAAARMESLPARPAINLERVVPGVCMVDNRSGVFCLVSATGQVYVPAKVLLDSGAQPLMLGKIACISLGVRRSELEPCPFQIQTSLGSTSDRSYRMTRERISVQLRHEHAQDSSQFGVRAVVTSAESYDVLVGGAVLYPMGFRMDYWTETAAYRPSWESGDGRMSELPVRFISQDRPLGSSPAVLASIAGFIGVLTWLDDLLEGNRSAEDTPVYEEVEEMVSLAAAVSSFLDVPVWDSCHALQQEADRLVKKAWSEASLPAEAERVSDGRLVCGLSTLSPLVTTPIVWEYSPEGVCLLDLFGGINTGLAAVLQSGILVRRYLYVEKDETARRVSSRHVTQLMQRFPLLLPRSAV